MLKSVIKSTPCIERARKKLNKRKSAACSQRARGRASHGQSPLGSTRAYFPELAPLGLDSGTRGYNPRCRDTVALPPPSSLEWAKARVEREKADIWLNPRARRRGRRDPGRGWALRAFIKTPAPLPHPSSPPAPGPGPGTVFRATHFRRLNTMSGHQSPRGTIIGLLFRGEKGKP